MSLFSVGKSVGEKLRFPEHFGFREKLEHLDRIYHTNHQLDGSDMVDPQTGHPIEGIGNYRLQSFHEGESRASIVSNTPYPSKFDEGLLQQLVRDHAPDGGARKSVHLDMTREFRARGGESCTFLISW